tara:strand:- start:423 stop:689 length:267 start_codon:yes stop_codon:yes gene_type:complete
MSEETFTQEEVRSSINAAFDSVGLINGIVDGNQMEAEEIQEKKDTIDRNVGHLDIMTGKDWFNNGLEEGEADQIAAAITNGNDFIAAN